MFLRKAVFLLAINILWIPVNSLSDFGLDHEEPIILRVDSELEDYQEGVALKSWDAFSISFKICKALERILQEMPSGWPQDGVPPLAPYTKENFTLDYKSHLFTLYSYFERFQIFNLNQMEINKLKNHLLKRRIDFDFTFPNITTLANVELNGFLDLLSIFGIRSDFKAKGDFNFGFQNIRLNGTARYSVSLIFGSFSIYDLQMSLQLGDMKSQMKGVINSKSITKEFNDLVRKQVLAIFNQYKSLINWLLSHLLETRANQVLEGRKIWDLI